MHKYRVLINCENLLSEIDGARKRLGFYTHVFVEAFTSADAESRAIKLLHEDAALRDIQLNSEDAPLKLSIEETEKLESFDGFKVPRSSFMLYEIEKSGLTPRRIR